MPNILQVGDRAPEFELAASDGNQYRLSSVLEDHAALLIFYPANDTPGWNIQLGAVRDDMSEFEARGIKPFGINPASVEKHAKYVQKKDYNFPLLSDPERKVAQAYGAAKESGKSVSRSVFVVGKDGKIVFAKQGLPDDAEILASYG